MEKIEIENILRALRSEGYICEKKIVASVVAALTSKPTAGAFLFGPAGAGKTFLAETLARVEGAEIFFFQCFPGTREEDLLIKILPAEDTVSGVKLYDGVIMQACQAVKAGKLAYLILDEWDKTRPSADSFLLDFLQSGRVNYNGRQLQLSTEERSLLRVFVTMNDERELSEPLLRRLPLIKFEPLHPAMVREALQMTHGSHPQLEAAVNLYTRSLSAGLTKPVTIQELRQLLDAITILGDFANWNDLVFQFVTKTEENHALLQGVEEIPVDELQIKSRMGITLNPEAYEEIVSTEIENSELTATLPACLDSKVQPDIKNYVVDYSEFEKIISSRYSNVNYREEIYNILIDSILNGKEIESLLEIVNNRILLKKPLDLEADFEKINRLCQLLDEDEEILISLNKEISKEDILNYRQYIKIAYIDDNNNIYCKFEDIKIKFTYNSIQNNYYFEAVVSNTNNIQKLYSLLVLKQANCIPSIFLDESYEKYIEKVLSYVKKEFSNLFINIEKNEIEEDIFLLNLDKTKVKDENVIKEVRKRAIKFLEIVKQAQAAGVKIQNNTYAATGLKFNAYYKTICLCGEYARVASCAGGIDGLINQLKIK